MKLVASARVVFALSAMGMVTTLSIASDVPRMDQIVRSFGTNKQFMGSVLVAENGKVLLDKGYGYANLEWQVPNSPESKFRLGSITKQFTAACILLLEERGKLSTDDLVNKYMSDAPRAWDKITIYNLLTHTSGIPNFTSFPDYHASEATPTTPAKLVERFLNKPLDFQPGEKFQYSNSNYILLGYLLEKISGQSYQNFLAANIFKSLGMNDSGYDSNSDIIPHRAAGYMPGPNGSANASYIDMTIPFSAGALYSTTEDLLRWEVALFGGKVLRAAAFKKMTTPFKGDYACGLMVSKMKGRTVIQHGGGIEGFNTQMAYYPEEKLTIIALANLNGAAPGEISDDLASVVHGEKVVLPWERKAISLPVGLLKVYVGVYQLAPEFSITITLEGEQLMSQGTHQPTIPLFAQSKTSFFTKAVNAEIDFFPNEKGQVTYLVLHQGGREIKGVKK